MTQVYGNDGNVGSTTTTHTGLFLVDREGVEHAVQLVNLDVPCRPGNIISMISAEGRITGALRPITTHPGGWPMRMVPSGTSLGVGASITRSGAR